MLAPLLRPQEPPVKGDAKKSRFAAGFLVQSPWPLASRSVP